MISIYNIQDQMLIITTTLTMNYSSQWNYSQFNYSYDFNLQHSRSDVYYHNHFDNELFISMELQPIQLQLRF